MQAGPYVSRLLYMEMCQVVLPEYKIWDVVGYMLGNMFQNQHLHIYLSVFLLTFISCA